MALNERAVQNMIEQELSVRLGWSIAILGSKEIQRVLESRCSTCKLPNLAAYCDRLQTNPEEWQELIEQLVVPETWFFRDHKPFDFLKQYVLSEWLPSAGKRILRVLSVPCSSGEEPYTVAMTLLDAGISPQRFEIDAVDISDRSLQKAQRGFYGRNSFRSSDLAFRDRHFSPTPDGYVLSEQVKQTVQFLKGNLLDPHFLMTRPAYDVVFCRNVLIYFDTTARTKVLQTLNRLLLEQGILFVGCAETTEVSQSSLTSVQFPQAFAYRKPPQAATATATLPSPIPSSPSTPARSVATPVPSTRKVHRNAFSSRLLPLTSRPEIPPPQKVQTPQSSPISDPIPSLEIAHQLANQGSLQEAAVICQAYLIKKPTDAEGYVLLGQIHQAQNREMEAEACFQRAVYLEPQHPEALMHLALLKEQRGDRQVAERLRQRIRRSQS